LSSILGTPKQHWGLEDFMGVNETPVYNSANLAMFMVNVSQAFMRPMRSQWPELSVNDLKTWFRSRKYRVETLKLLPEMPEAIFIDQAIAQVAQLGRLTMQSTLPKWRRYGFMKTNFLLYPGDRR
jgi:hypothetical protein